jgi:hypothetical protein
VDAAEEKTKKHGCSYRAYKCRQCHFWHLTTKQPDRVVKYKNKKGSTRGSKQATRFRERRRVYRKEILPLEVWENEGGSAD